MQQKFSIGIDTGGTYTDAVIIDLIQGKVLASAKALTTKGNLAHGISEAMSQVVGQIPEAIEYIRFVSLSTTLCTNALVEGHGSSLGVVLVGFDEDMVGRTQLNAAIPDAKVVRINGGHFFSGMEANPLDEKALKIALSSELSKVSAFAVASHYSTRNPEHERRVQSIIANATDMPVTASCDLSSALDAPKRALTACFNARIISMIYQLEQSVTETMQSLGLNVPIMIVKGDGAVSHIHIVRDKPIETILSGPAASVIGARFLTGLEDFIISDIGGTTTDVATVINGWPALNEKGSMVGEYRTLTRAIDMKTIGLGGDSQITLGGLNGFQLQLASHKVIPISLLANKWPHIEQSLDAALGESSGMATSLQYIVKPTANINKNLSELDRAFIDSLPENYPVAFSDCVNGAGNRTRIKRLIEYGLIQMSGLTPSDASHVLGYQSQWSFRAAELGCELLGRAQGFVSENRFKQKQELAEKVNQFAAKIFELVCRKSTRLMIDELVDLRQHEQNVFIDAVCNATEQPRIKNLDINFRPSIPLVAVGGPASVFYKEVGRRLNSETVIPTGSEVANAIGAAVGAQKITAQINVNRAEKNGYLLHYIGEPLHCESADDALLKAKELVTQLVINNAFLQSGTQLDRDSFAETVNVDIQQKVIRIPNLEGNESLVSATITAEIVRST